MMDLKKHFDIQVHATNQSMWYWRIPKRWHVHKAVLKDTKGNTIADYNDNPLHLWAYSHLFSGIISKEKLISEHIFSNPTFPEFIPFRFRQMVRHWKTD